MVAVATTFAAASAITGSTLTVPADHLWVMGALVVAAAVVRAVGEGGPRSVLALAGVVLIAQPALHTVGELLGPEGRVVTHGGIAGLLLLASHISFTALLIGVLVASESAARVAVSAARVAVSAMRRLLRVLIRPTRANPETEALKVVTGTPHLSHEQRARAPQPPRRGPPISLPAHLA